VNKQNCRSRRRVLLRVTCLCVTAMIQTKVLQNSTVKKNFVNRKRNKLKKKKKTLHEFSHAPTHEKTKVENLTRLIDVTCNYSTRNTDKTPRV